MGSPDDLSTDLGRLRALVSWGQTTPAELSRLASLAPPHLGMVLRGDIKSLSAETARKVAATTDCTLGWLMAGEGDPPAAADVLAAVERARLAAQPVDEPRPSHPAAA